MINKVFEKAAGYVLAPFQSSEIFLTALAGGVRAFTDVQSKTGWLYMMTSLVIAAVVYAVGSKQGWIGAKSLPRFLFPREVYLHRSARVDYKFVAIDLTIKLVVYTPLISGFSTLLYTSLVGTMSSLGLSSSLLLSGTITGSVAVVLIADFGFFLAHYLMHKIPELWYFHEVHHSAEVLTPITVYRTHPVEDLVNAFVAAVMAGVGAAIYTSATSNEVTLPTILGVNVVNFLFFSFAFQLRHSHIWLSYGPLVSRIFISPAQHQIHHSVDARHWDRNFGFMFAFWDSMFRSLYVPKSRETLHFGVPGADPQDFSTVKKLYFLPFLKAGRLLQRRLRENVGKAEQA